MQEPIQNDKGLNKHNQKKGGKQNDQPMAFTRTRRLRNWATENINNYVDTAADEGVIYTTHTGQADSNERTGQTPVHECVDITDIQA